MPAKPKGYGPETGLTYVKRYKDEQGNIGGGYVHTERAKRFEREAQSRRRARRREEGEGASVASPAATTVPIPGASPTAPVTPVPATEQAAVAGNPPPWWIASAYSKPTEDQQFANVANALLPTLSPEDQRNLSRYLATNFKDVFGGYANTEFAPIPNQLSNERAQYLNPQRAQAALGVLERMKTASGQTMGTGYQYLLDAVNLLNKYTSGGPMTREQYTQFSAALKGLEAQAGSNITAYKNLAQMFNSPSFSAGQLMSNAPSTRLNV